MLRAVWRRSGTGLAGDPGPGTSRGQGLVELALALPVLLLILLGTIDLGRMFFDYVAMRNAAREAAGSMARHGNSNPNSVANATARATNHGGLPSNAVVTVTCTGDGCTLPGKNGEAKAVITSTFTPVATGFLQTYFGIGPIQLQAEASMRVLT